MVKEDNICTNVLADKVSILFHGYQVDMPINGKDVSSEAKAILESKSYLESEVVKSKGWLKHWADLCLKETTSIGDFDGKKWSVDDQTVIYPDQSSFEKDIKDRLGSELNGKELIDFINFSFSTKENDWDSLNYILLGEDDADKISRLVDRWGCEYGQYESVFTLPDGKVLVRFN